MPETVLPDPGFVIVTLLGAVLSTVTETDWLLDWPAVSVACAAQCMRAVVDRHAVPGEGPAVRAVRIDTKQRCLIHVEADLRDPLVVGRRGGQDHRAAVDDGAALGAVIVTLGRLSTFSTVTETDWLLDWPAVSVACAVRVYEPSLTAVLSQGDGPAVSAVRINTDAGAVDEERDLVDAVVIGGAGRDVDRATNRGAVGGIRDRDRRRRVGIGRSSGRRRPDVVKEAVAKDRP